MRGAVLDHFGHGARDLQVGVLGVTPEVVWLAWPPGSSIHAFDHSADMVKKVWRPHSTLTSDVCLTDWSGLPLASGSVDVFAGDNSLGALPTFAKSQDVLRELHRTLKPTGLVCLRCFIAPEVPETLEAIKDDVDQGRVRSFHALKWRVAMALCSGPDQNVVVHRIVESFDSLFPDREALSRAHGWPVPVINTLEAYRNNDVLYTFFTLAALERFASPWFRIQGIQYPEYELAERCPTVTLVPHAGVAP
ncbi:MAG: class I SAM-dependent methyltransferase, partial [Rhodoferax sp.]